jgi:hypothetical protein
LDRVAARSRSPWLAKESRCFPYSHEGFTDRIDAIYTRAVADYRPYTPPPRWDRDEYLWLLTQLAPFFLVDGCWLQQSGRLITFNPEVAAVLFDTYADEIGAGDPRQNHSNVFRDLLRREGITLPSVTSLEFSTAPIFADSVFVLPVFLLAISQHTRRFLPELIGLNLAIELSGLGAFYMRLVDELRYWNIDPTIITLHISIDNYSTGHAAMARKLVGTYLDQIFAAQGYSAMQAHWRRVWTGYLALASVSQRSFLGLIPAYLKRFGWKRLQRVFAGARPTQSWAGK